MVDPEVKRLRKLEAAKRYYSTPEGKARVLAYGRKYYAKNKAQMIEYNKKRYSRPEIRERVRELQFRRHYGITVEEYRHRLSEQGGVCAICRKSETALYRGQIKMLAVDHDHETGAIRGLLCNRCNLILGAAQDDPETLRRALLYLNPIHTGGSHHAVDG